MTGLPRFVAFRSKESGKYLRFVAEPGRTHGLFEFSGNEVMTPFTRFELELTSYQGPLETDLLNIRCCYNNKYWRKKFEESSLIFGGPHQPNEDPKEWSSTLFKVLVNQGDDEDCYSPKNVQIEHHHDGLVSFLTLCGGSESKLYSSCLRNINKDSNGKSTVFEMINLDELMIMPKFVALKGDAGFLRIYTYKNDDYLQFTGTDTSDPSVACEIITNPDGSIRIRSIRTGKFWSLSSNDWIFANTEEGSNTNSSSFRNSCFLPLKVKEDIIALRNLGNNKFCKRFSPAGLYVENCLCANFPNIYSLAEFKIVELVSSRQIYNVRFHEKDARVYHSNDITLASEQVKNESQTALHNKVSLAAERVRISTWNRTNSWNLGPKSSISVTFTPYVQGNLQVVANSEKNCRLGESKETKDTVSSEKNIIVEPKTEITTSIAGIRAYIDLPFTYSQCDTLIDGKTVVYESLHDGVYTCLDTYKIRTALYQKDLSPDGPEME